ncbi:Receptor-type tyrosine-protein phosphatase-like N, partial [Clarias magur]
GVFGQCQRFPVSDLYTYETSPAALQRLRNLLHHLVQQGYTWQDDAAQQAISRELLALPKIPLQRLRKNFPAFKLRAQSSEANNRKYLQELGFLPVDVTSSKQGLQGKYKSKGMPDLMDLFMKPKERPPSALSTSLHQPRPGPKNSYWTEIKPGDQTELLDQTGLLSELQRYLSDPKEQPAGPSQKDLQYFGHSSSAKAGKVSGVSRQPPPPRIDKLLFRAGVNRPTVQDSLSSVDEKFIQGVVKQLGQQSINTDSLSPGDLDQLSEVITQVLQEVDDEERVKGSKVKVNEEGAMKREPGTWEKPGTMSEEEFTPKDLGQTKESKLETEGKDKLFLSQLLDFLDSDSEPEATDHPRDEISLFDVPQKPAGPKSAGVEIVRSRTTQTRVDLTRKKMEPDTVDLQDAGDEAEVEQWLRGKDMKNDGGGEGAERKEGHLEKKLRVDVTAYSTPQRDGDFGYIVTQDALSTDQGLNLMETLAKRANLRVTDFLQLS